MPMSIADFFAAPPFNADDALALLKRELRGLGLSEREGGFERKGTSIARLALQGGAILAERVRRPSRASPEWLPKVLTSGADGRDFVADLKKQLAQWSDQDD